MDPIAQSITEILKLGLPGAIIIVISFAYWRKSQQFDDLQAEFRNSLIGVHEKRVDDMRSVVAANTGATNAQTEAFRNLTDMLRDDTREPSRRRT